MSLSNLFKLFELFFNNSNLFKSYVTHSKRPRDVCHKQSMVYTVCKQSLPISIKINHNHMYSLQQFSYSNISVKSSWVWRGFRTCSEYNTFLYSSILQVKTIISEWVGTAPTYSIYWMNVLHTIKYMFIVRIRPLIQKLRPFLWLGQNDCKRIEPILWAKEQTNQC